MCVEYLFVLFGLSGLAEIDGFIRGERNLEQRQ